MSGQDLPAQAKPLLQQTLSRRYANFALIAIAILAVPIFFGAYKAVQTNSNQFEDWLPKNLPETAQLEQFGRWFGKGSFVVVSWDGCRINTDRTGNDTSGDDPRIEKFVQQLNRLDSNEFIKSVMTSRDLLKILTDSPLDLPAPHAASRLRGSVIGPSQQACVLVQFNELTAQQLPAAIGTRHPRMIDRNRPQGLILSALQRAGIELDDAHLGGPPVDHLSINEEGQRTLLRLGLAAGLLGIGLAYLSLRSVSLTIIVFTCGILTTAGAMASIWITGSHADAIVMAMPSLIYVLTVSGAIHLINHYRMAVSETGLAMAVNHAVKSGFRPALLCNLTTAFGLLSLLSSDLTPIRNFGIFSALGMAWMLVVLFGVLPLALKVFGGPTGFGVLSERTASISLGFGSGKSLSKQNWLDIVGARTTLFAIRRHWWISCVGLLLLFVSAAGMSRLSTNVDLLKLFDDDSRVLNDYRWLEANLGNLVPMEVLVKFENPENSSIIDRAELVRDVIGAIGSEFGSEDQRLISRPISTLTFLPAIARSSGGISNRMRRTAMSSQFENSRNALRESGYWTIDPETGDEVWRISLRIAAFKDVDLERFTNDMRQVVEPILAFRTMSTEPDAVSLEGVTAIYTGSIPIVHKAQRELLQSLIQGSFWSFVTITPVMIFVTGGVLSGLLAMIPNLMPVVGIFGTLGWLGIPIDIGCMMTASIALGVAVDDTIHYLHWYRHFGERVADRAGQIRATSETCFRPTVQAALINGLGLSIFFLSTFTPTRQFGVLMLVILTLGAIAELVLLPAVLAGPCGRVLERKRLPVRRQL